MFNLIYYSRGRGIHFLVRIKPLKFLRKLVLTIPYYFIMFCLWERSADNCVKILFPVVVPVFFSAAFVSLCDADDGVIDHADPGRGDRCGGRAGEHLVGRDPRDVVSGGRNTAAYRI